jgi:hypothetical protein
VGVERQAGPWGTAPIRTPASPRQTGRRASLHPSGGPHPHCCPRGAYHSDQAVGGLSPMARMLAPARPESGTSKGTQHETTSSRRHAHRDHRPGLRRRRGRVHQRQSTGPLWPHRHRRRPGAPGHLPAAGHDRAGPETHGGPAHVPARASRLREALAQALPRVQRLRRTGLLRARELVPGRLRPPPSRARGTPRHAPRRRARPWGTLPEVRWCGSRPPCVGLPRAGRRGGVRGCRSNLGGSRA